MLGVAAAFGTLVAALLLFRHQNRLGNRFLAALLIVAVLRLMPYVLGFAGFYDVYPWLSFAPFDLALATGPLLYLYVRQLAMNELPARWPLHFLPAALDLVYTGWAFSLPLGTKLAWNDHWHRPYVEPVERIAAAVSLAAYLILAFRVRRLYRSWLDANLSNEVDHRQPWIGTVLIALGLWLLVGAGFDIADGLFGLTYYDRFPQYLVFAAIVIGLGLEGWRHAGQSFPPIRPVLAPTIAAPSRDWPTVGAAWAERIRTEGWWREPGLSLAEVARRLATNETYVSKAFNEGLRRNFNAVINGFRVEAVKARLRESNGDLLDIALASGFASKASFNRVFREQVGMSPTAWQAAAQILEVQQNRAFEATSEASAGM